MQLELDPFCALVGAAVFALFRCGNVRLSRAQKGKSKKDVEADYFSALHNDEVLCDFLTRKGCLNLAETSPEQPSIEEEPEPEDQQEEAKKEHDDPPQKVGPFTMLRLSFRQRALVTGASLVLVWLYPYVGAVRGMAAFSDELRVTAIQHKPVATIELQEQVMGATPGKRGRSAYYGTLQLGQPSKPFTFVFDTGSGHLIVPSGYCHSQTCKMHKRYRRSESKTGKDIDGDGSLVPRGGVRDQLQVQFGTGDVTSVFVEDIVCLDEKVMKNLEDVSSSTELPAGCMRMRFLAATAMSDQPFQRFEFDGVLGLGLSGLSQSEEFNFMHTLAGAVKDWGSKAPYQFGVFIGTGEEKAELALGGWDADHVEGDVSWNQVLRPEEGHWIINVKSLRVDGKVLPFCKDGCKAVVDSGTSLMSVPTKVFPELYDALRVDAALDGECTGSGPQLHFELDHFTVTMDQSDYSVPQQYKTRTPDFQRAQEGRSPFISREHGTTTRNDVYCRPMLMSMDMEEPLGPKLFILGEPVLKKYYTVYDAEVKRVGFGKAFHKPKPATKPDDDLDAEWWDEDDEDE